MRKKDKLLQEYLEATSRSDSYLEVAYGGFREDEVYLWVIYKSNIGTSLVLETLTWCGDAWADDMISEQEGPALLNCPVRLLQYPVDEDMKFPEWRQEVLKYHEQMGGVVQDEESGTRLIKALEKKFKK